MADRQVTVRSHCPFCGHKFVFETTFADGELAEIGRGNEEEARDKLDPRLASLKRLWSSHSCIAERLKERNG